MSCIKRIVHRTRKKTYLRYLISIIYSISGIKEDGQEMVVNTSPDTEHSNADQSSISVVHYPIRIASRLRCRYCNQRGIIKDVNTSCSKCLIPLCVIDCFERWHNGEVENN